MTMKNDKKWISVIRMEREQDVERYMWNCNEILVFICILTRMKVDTYIRECPRTDRSWAPNRPHSGSPARSDSCTSPPCSRTSRYRSLVDFGWCIRSRPRNSSRRTQSPPGTGTNRSLPGFGRSPGRRDWTERIRWFPRMFCRCSDNHADICTRRSRVGWCTGHVHTDSAHRDWPGRRMRRWNCTRPDKYLKKFQKNFKKISEKNIKNIATEIFSSWINTGKNKYINKINWTEF